jgi:U4/U6.U5 tri-snRNP-associated protein 2
MTDQQQQQHQQPPNSNSTSCPYLDTINRTSLDFDFSPHCSITLDSSPHIYACLVCGKYFRGRGRHTPAYTHSVDAGHAVYLHLERGTYWCLPEDYEIGNEPSLDDISAALRPRFTEREVEELDGRRELARDLFGRRYLPGFVGLNNLNKTDYLNCVVQALGHVRLVNGEGRGAV